MANAEFAAPARAEFDQGPTTVATQTFVALFRIYLRERVTFSHAPRVMLDLSLLCGFVVRPSVPFLRTRRSRRMR